MEIYEILDDVNEALSREDKMKVLANNDCLALRDIMKINFDPSVNIHISKNLPWQPNMEANKSLRDVTKYLVPLSTGKIDQDRADKSFVALLEAIHPMDAQILLEATKGQIKVKGLTQKLIQGVWGERIISK
jgi:hypothetical protein